MTLHDHKHIYHSDLIFQYHLPIKGTKSPWINDPNVQNECGAFLQFQKVRKGSKNNDSRQTDLQWQGMWGNTGGNWKKTSITKDGTIWVTKNK